MRYNNSYIRMNLLRGWFRCVRTGAPSRDSLHKFADRVLSR